MFTSVSLTFLGVCVSKIIILNIYIHYYNIEIPCTELAISVPLVYTVHTVHTVQYSTWQSIQQKFSSNQSNNDPMTFDIKVIELE